MGKQNYRYWLRCVPGLSNRKIKKLLESCQTAEEVYRMKREHLLLISDIGEAEVKAIEESRRHWDLDREIEKLLEKGIAFVTMEQKQYPKRLHGISDCPYALFYRGRLPGEKPAVAIVGARCCSGYGREVALRLGEALACYDVDVISGMAAGIDSFGHWGAIRGGGDTYAVLGCGPDVCYPKGGRELYERILSCGGILSEYLPQTAPDAWRFPARNRIISGLADIVVVVEAKKKSGSLITADFALEQGKDIYAVPGRINDVLSEGCNALIRQGAGVIPDIQDFLSELGIEASKPSADTGKTKNLLEKQESLVYSCFDLQTKSMEELIRITGMCISELADILVRLQAKGLIEEYYKNHFRKR